MIAKVSIKNAGKGLIPCSLKSFSTQTPLKPEIIDYSHLGIYNDKSVSDLIIYYSVNKLCSKSIFVDNSLKLYNFSSKILGKGLSNFVIKNTMGKMFTGGANLKEMEFYVKNLNEKKNLNTVLFYSNEAVPGVEISQKEMDHTAEVCVGKVMTATAYYSDKNMVAVKYSALGNYEAIKQCNAAQNNLTSFYLDSCKRLSKTGSDLTVKELKDSLRTVDSQITEADLGDFFKQLLGIELSPSTENLKITLLDWRIKLHAFYVLSSEKSNNKVLNHITKLSGETKNQLNLFASRLSDIFAMADKKNCRVMVDAEQTYLQRTIDSFTEQFQYKYNTVRPLIYNTFQNYLKATEQRVDYEIAKCKKLQMPLGMKMVRGAYMVEESHLAKKGGYENPVCPNYDATTSNINRNLTQVIEQMTPSSEILLASHNVKTVELVKNLLQERNIDKLKGGVKFAQLLGLADHITFSLHSEGYNIYKYIPFGQTHIMVPYLIRRAQESKQMLSSVNLQVDLIKKEVAKRMGLRK